MILDGKFGGRLEVQWHLDGVAFIIHCGDRLKRGKAVGIVLSPEDSRLIAPEILTLAQDSETYGTPTNPVVVP